MAIRNTLLDVHNILMEQLECLNDAETDEELEFQSKKVNISVILQKLSLTMLI